MSPRKQVIKTSSALSSGGDGDCVESDDTDEEMFQEELPHSSMSLSRRRERVVKAKPKEMSEEEMMELALRLSEQEASIAAAKRQQEEEAMTEALKESLFSQTQPCASPPSQRYHGNTDPSPKLPSRRQLAYSATARENVSLAEEPSVLSVKNDPRGAGNHKDNMRKRKREDGVPVPERADLAQTQKICSQSSTLEPLCSQTNGLNHKDEESESTSGDLVGKPTTAAFAVKEKHAKGDAESNPAIMKMTSDMNLRWSDNEEDLEQSEGSPSPVFPVESRPQQAEDQTGSPEHSRSATSSHSPKRLRLNPAPGALAAEAAGSGAGATCPRVPRSGLGPFHTQEPFGRVPAPPEGPRGEPLVHYYWGVPFCPQGLDPDRYTQVILAQMEVYEKSLKNAQRGLLRKAEWGDGITPKPEEPLEDSPELIPTISLRRPGLRSRRRAAGVKLSDEEDEDEGGRVGDVEREGVEPAEEEDLDVVGCDVCPETQLSGDETQDLLMGTGAGEETQPDSPSLLQIQSLPRSRGEEEEEEENHTQDLDKKGEEGDGGDCEQPAVMSPSREQAPLSGQEEEEEETQGAVGAEERKEAGPEAGSSVDCPICQSAFPLSEIEMHAAFCDGEQEVVECPVEDSPVSHRPSKRRALKSLATEDRGTGDPSGHALAPQGREKCYVCHKSIPLAEYPGHTESCLQRQRPHAASLKGDLLSALETTERRHPGGPSMSKLGSTPRDEIDLSNNNDDQEDDDQEEGGSGHSSTFRVSDSPIRAFTSISEASDCLVDFRRQSAPREPGQRPRGRRGGGGGGFKRKFKRR